MPGPSPPPLDAWRDWARRLAGLLALLLGACSMPPISTPAPEPAVQAAQNLASSPLARRVQALRQGQASGTGFALLDSPGQALATRLDLIGAAQRSLDIQYYAIHADGSTDVLLAALRAAAARGVHVRLLLDDFNTTGAQAQVMGLAYEPHMEVRLFNPLPGPRHSSVLRILRSLGDIERMQRRMHNKLMVADGAVAITGGRNLGDAYFGPAEDGAFIDVDMLAAGEGVQDVRRSFELYWGHALAVPAQALASRHDLQVLQTLNPARRPLPQTRLATPTARDMRLEDTLARLVWAPSQVITDSPHKLQTPPEAMAHNADSLIDHLLRQMQGARQQVLIVTPYLVPGRRIQSTLAGLVRQGVRVRVLTNSLASTDAPAAHLGYARHRRALLEAGIELFEMQAERPAGLAWSRAAMDGRARLHTKLVVVDEQWLVTGSMNLDLRSQWQNTENALLVHSAQLARQALLRAEATLASQAYQVLLRDGRLRWRPPGEPAADLLDEPQASAGLQWIIRLLSPFVPDDML